MKPHFNEVTSPGPWNKRRLTGQKAPLKLNELWAIRIRLVLANKVRDLALFNLVINSKLRGCDLVSLRVCEGEKHPLARHDSAAEDTSTCVVRDHRADSAVGVCLDQ